LILIFRNAAGLPTTGGRRVSTFMNYHEVNSERRYFNFKGALPPVPFESFPAEFPLDSTATHPKLLTDTTLRDGAQDPCFAIFPNKAKLAYFDLLHALDNGTGVIDAIEVFIYQKRDLWTLEKLLERGYDFPRVTAWTRATPKDIRDLLRVSSGKVKETGMLASCSDHHIFDRLNFRSKQAAIETYLEPILTACENGIIPRIHLEDATRADVEGWVIPFMVRVMEETKGLARFRICDTLGVGIPDPYAALPFGIPRLVATLAQATEAELEFHGHNDFGYATANSMAAYRYGCKRVNVTIAGLGERTGNAPLEQVLANYIRVYGNPGLNLSVLSEMAKLIQEHVVPLSPKQPIVGANIFTTQAGLHQTGIRRQSQAPGGLIYQPFDPQLLGYKGLEMNRIGSLSGMDGIVAVLNRYLEETGNNGPSLTVTSRVVKIIYDMVHQAYDGWYDEKSGSFLDFRTEFFDAEELARMLDTLSGNSVKTEDATD
jgi:isopropylmalate/homocitrate/citramalate synthase